MMKTTALQPTYKTFQLSSAIQTLIIWVNLFIQISECQLWTKISCSHMNRWLKHARWYSIRSTWFWKKVNWRNKSLPIWYQLKWREFMMLRLRKSMRLMYSFIKCTMILRLSWRNIRWITLLWMSDCWKWIRIQAIWLITWRTPKWPLTSIQQFWHA